MFSLGTGVATVPAWAIAGRRVQRVLTNRTVPLLAIFSAFSLTIMMFNVPVPGGTTAHGVGGTLLAIVLGPWAAVIGVSVGLIIQALFFGDGGILAIFANCLNMGVILPFAGYGAYRRPRRDRQRQRDRTQPLREEVGRPAQEERRRRSGGGRRRGGGREAAGLSGDPVFSLRGVRYRYHGRHVALDGVDLEIGRGEQVVLLGANGCGKSTLLKVLDGIMAPTGGEMTVLGQPVRAVLAGDAAHRFHRQVGLVFQDPDVQLFSATVLDDVAFGPLQLGLPPDEVTERGEALAQMGIAHLADRAPFELSGGEKKRAAIASVLSLRPEVLLLDEPTASLDPRTKWVLVNLIRELGRRGGTIVTTTHELDIVPVIADRVVVMGEERRVIAAGPPDAVLGDRDLLVRANLIHERLHPVRPL